MRRRNVVAKSVLRNRCAQRAQRRRQLDVVDVDETSVDRSAKHQEAAAEAGDVANGADEARWIVCVVLRVADALQRVDADDEANAGETPRLLDERRGMRDPYLRRCVELADAVAQCQIIQLRLIDIVGTDLE